MSASPRCSAALCGVSCCRCIWQKALQRVQRLSVLAGSCWNAMPWTRRHPQIQPLDSGEKEGNLEWTLMNLGPSRIIRVVHMVPAGVVERRSSLTPSATATPRSARLPRRHNSDSQLHLTSHESLPDDPATLPCFYDSDSSHSSFVAAVRDEKMWKRCFHHRFVPRSRPNHTFTSRLGDRDGPDCARKEPENEVNKQTTTGTNPGDVGGDGQSEADGGGSGSSSSIDGSYPNLAFQGDGDCGDVEAGNLASSAVAEPASQQTGADRSAAGTNLARSRSASFETVRRSVLNWLGQNGCSSTEKQTKRRLWRRHSHDPSPSTAGNSAPAAGRGHVTTDPNGTAKKRRLRRRRRRRRNPEPPTAVVGAVPVAGNGQVTTDPNGEDFLEISPSFQARKPLKNNRVLFFIHGVGGSAETWKSQILYFVKAGYEVIAPDILGHGFSSAPDNMKAFKFKRLLADMVSIFDKFVVLGRKAVIVGHSYGCSFATKLARMRPDGVCLLVLISGGGPAPLVPPTGGLMALPTWLLQQLQPCLWFHIRRSLLNNQGSKSVSLSQAYDIPPYVLHHVIRGQNWPEGDVGFHRRIFVPVLLMYGMQDPLVSLVEMCEMERTLPRAHLELLNKAGHMVMLDAPDQVNRIIHRFLLKYSRLTYCY